MTVKVFKMISGEELIAEVTSGGEMGYFVENPAVIMMQQNQQGQVGVGLMPYMPYLSGKIYIHKHAITADGVPEVKMENEYKRIFGSGIQIVGAEAMSSL